jgi:hypothetical protein
MRKPTREKRIAVLSALTEGCSVRSTSRLCGVSKLTVLRLLNDIGQLCEDYHFLKVVGLHCQRVQVDEVWAFVNCKEKARIRTGAPAGAVGDAWLWVALDADTKLVVSYHVGLRTIDAATAFMRDVASRIDNRFQLTSDGLPAYLDAVYAALGGEIGFATLVKMYGKDLHSPERERRYSPPVCLAARPRVIRGIPDPAHNLHQLHRTPELDGPHAQPSLHSADQRLQQEVEEPPSRNQLALLPLQLHPQAPDHRDDTGPGGGDHRYALDGRRPCGPVGAGRKPPRERRADQPIGSELRR